jgi:hypothetical protein
MNLHHARGRRARARRGVLAFEWILIVTLLVIGLIAGLAAVRNALLDELYDLEGAVEAMNFSGSGSPPDRDTGSHHVADDANTWWGSGYR